MPFREFEMSDEFLHLMQHVVIDHFVFMLNQLFLNAIVNGKEIVSELWYHEDLLHHAVHVADAAEIPETHISLRSLTHLTSSRFITPILWLFDRGE